MKEIRQMNWEVIDECTMRGWVAGGWVLKTSTPVHIDLHGFGRLEEGYEMREALVFIPDTYHRWIIGEKQNGI